MARILFLNPSVEKYGRTPIGITTYSGLLKKHGHEVRLFDTTLFDTSYLFNAMSKSATEKQEEFVFYQKVNTQINKPIKIKVDVVQKLNDLLDIFKPDVVAFSLWSCMLTGEDEYRMLERGLTLLKKCYRRKYLVVVGGILPSLNPEKIIKKPLVDIVCVGEGEYAFLDLANKIDVDKTKIKKIKNLWVKKDKEIYKNEMRPLIVDLDNLPMPDFELFDDKLFYRPYHGEIIRAIDYEFSRGCYYNCTYCISPILRKLYGSPKNYRRERGVEKIVSDLSFLKEKYNLQMVKFLDELFLGLSEEKLKRLSIAYANEVNLPFVMETTINSITERKLKYLKRMGCLSMSLGIESGNDKFRIKVLKKNITSDQIIKKIKLLNKYKIDYSLFTIIGFPFETRKIIFDTIKLYKKIKAKCVSCSYFQPFVGTELTKTCLKKGYIKEEIKYAVIENSSLELPLLSNKELKGLMKAFMLYVYYPFFLFPIIRVLEQDNKVCNKLYKLFKPYVIHKLKMNQNKYSTFIKQRAR